MSVMPMMHESLCELVQGLIDLPVITNNWVSYPLEIEPTELIRELDNLNSNAYYERYGARYVDSVLEFKVGKTVSLMTLYKRLQCLLYNTSGDSPVRNALTVTMDDLAHYIVRHLPAYDAVKWE